MKKFILLIVLSLSLLNCQKDKQVDIPEWLQNNITGLEQQIKIDPGTIVAYTAWVRFEWKNDYYFEYDNPSSSSHSGPNCYDGNILNSADFQVYENEKCCMKYVWKGPKY
ncbi:MAG TPA: hypothetical protein VHP38_02020 [Ruminiclostridium sp.]|nr:hypothetical protein [Ruminiclostridium sp.]